VTVVFLCVLNTVYNFVPFCNMFDHGTTQFRILRRCDHIAVIAVDDSCKANCDIAC